MFRLLASLICLLTAVTASAVDRSPDWVAEFARAQVLARLQSEGHPARVSVIGDRHPQSLLGTATLRPIDGRWPRARVAAVVDVVESDGTKASHTVWLAVEIPGEVLVYATAHYPGARLSIDQLGVRTTNLAAVTGTPIRPDSELADLRLARSVRAGQVAQVEQFERLPDVLRHQRVQLAVDRGAVSIRVWATAMQEGRIGDVVAVRAANATDNVEATVVAKGVLSLVQ